MASGEDQKKMRAFLAACLAVVVIAVGAYFVGDFTTSYSDVAYTTEGTRIK